MQGDSASRAEQSRQGPATNTTASMHDAGQTHIRPGPRIRIQDFGQCIMRALQIEKGIPAVRTKLGVNSDHQLSPAGAALLRSRGARKPGAQPWPARALVDTRQRSAGLVAPSCLVLYDDSTACLGRGEIATTSSLVWRSSNI